MANPRTKTQPTHLPATRRGITKLSALVPVVLLILVPAVVSALIVPLDYPATLYTWIPSLLGPMDRICVKGSGACAPRCEDLVPNSICAEFVSVDSSAGNCCIPDSEIGSSDINACIVETLIERDPQPEE